MPGWSAPIWVLALASLAVMAIALRWWDLGSRCLTRLTPSTVFQTIIRMPKRATLRLLFGPLDLYLTLLLAAVIGLLGALVSMLFREAIVALSSLYGGESESLSLNAINLSAWERVLVPVVGGLIAGLILQEIGNRLRGPKSCDYIEAIAVGDGWISARQSLVRAFSSLFSVASGGSIGREGSIVQLAAMVASLTGRVMRLSRERMRLLVAAGAAAGLAASYRAPLAAAVFVTEIVVGSIALEYVGPLMVAAVIASVTIYDILGYAPLFQIPDFALTNDWRLGLCLVLGLLAGHLAPLFLRLLDSATQLFARLPLSLVVRMTMGGLIVGLISAGLEPRVWGNGHTVVNSALLEPWAWQALATVLVFKLLATAATIGSGAIGGAFTPTLFVGAMLGLLFGALVQLVLPADTAPAGAYAVVGMGAMLAGTTHAPLMSILMILEMTTNYGMMLPLMLGVVTAHYTAARYTWVRPMYAESLLPRTAAPG
jgi:H+/Cl- antiporter ClcA